MTSRTVRAAGARIAVLAVLAVSIAGCGDTEEPTDPAPGTASAPVDAGAADGDAGDSDAGDSGAAAPASLPYTEELDGRRLTVISFGTSEPADPGLWEVADGHEMVYLEVEVENVDAEPWESNMVQFFLFDPTGEEHGTSFFDLKVGATPETKRLEVGDSVAGYVPFEVPAGITGLRLEYAVDLSAGKVITVQIN